MGGGLHPSQRLGLGATVPRRTRNAQRHRRQGANAQLQESPGLLRGRSQGVQGDYFYGLAGSQTKGVVYDPPTMLPQAQGRNSTISRLRRGPRQNGRHLAPTSSLSTEWWRQGAGPTSMGTIRGHHRPLHLQASTTPVPRGLHQRIPMEDADREDVEEVLEGLVLCLLVGVEVDDGL